MLSNKLKRCLSFLIAMLMIVSLMPVSVLATDEEVHDHSHEVVEQAAPETQEKIVTGEPAVEEPTAEVPAVTPNPEIERFQEMINEILGAYLPENVEQTPEAVKTAAEALSDEACENAWWEIMILEEEFMFACEDGLVTDAELVDLANANPLMIAFADVVILRAASTMPSMSFYATNLSPISGITVTDDNGSGSLSGTTVTITVKGGYLSTTTNNVKVTNTSGKVGTLSFNYSVTGHDSTTLPSTSGSYSATLDAGASYQFNVVAPKYRKTATLTLSNFSFVEAAGASDVGIEFDSAQGSVTAGGEAVSSGTTIGGVTSANGIALVATPASGYSFFGWVNKETRELMSSAASYTYKPAESGTLIAAFVKADSKAWFSVGNKYYDDLNTAAQAAVSAGGIVVLATNGTLPAGEYTIPAGVTLLIPYDDANTLCTTKPTVVTSGIPVVSLTTEAWAKPAVYRTLKIASGANISINGAMSISGKSSAQQIHNGCPSRSVGFVEMASGSSITVNSGANLYAWGYITGSGSVTVKSGGRVYENFQVKDWRGGSVASGMLDKPEKVFPVSQYYVQNVEVPMTLEAGASEYCHMGLVASKAYGETTAPFIGSNGMFRVQNGSITKDYIEETDRMSVQIYGDVTMSSLSLEVSLYNMNSANYVLPITNNITVNVKSGTTTISQDMCMLPGSEIIVGEGANVVLGKGVNFYVYDLAEWEGKLFVYSSKDVSPLAYVGCKKGAPVKRTLKDAKIEVNGTVDASAGYVYTTTGGANIIGSATGKAITGTPGTATNTWQYVQSGDGFTQVPITPAKLNHGNDTYLPTTENGAGNYGYCETCAKWYFGDECPVCNACNHTYASVITKPATCKEPGLKTYTCSGCGDTYTEDIPKLTTHTPGVAATCTTAQTCTVCGATIKDKLGHNMQQTAPAVAPTCTKAGSTAVMTCANNCGTTEGGAEIPATGHKYEGEWQKTETGHAKKCVKGCGGYETEVAHTSKTKETDRVEADCTNNGSYNLVTYCEVCEYVISTESKVITALGHTYGDWEVTKAATCTEAGSKKQTCENCGDVVTEVISKLDHTHTAKDEQPATCVTPGNEAGTFCTECDKYISGGKVIPATGVHKGGTATCTEKATCTECGQPYGDPLGHKLTFVEGNTATCVKDGVLDHYNCSVCGKNFADENGVNILEDKDLVLPAVPENHDLKSTVIDPTCTKQGYTLKACKNCEYSYKESYVDATGHSYSASWEWDDNKYILTLSCENCDDEVTKNGEVTAPDSEKSATCSTPGEVVYKVTVSVSGVQFTGTNTVTIPATNHANKVNKGQQDATCTEDGYTAGVYCPDCKTWLSGHEVIKSEGHKYSEAVTKAATCTEDGVKTFTCKCGDTYTEAIDALGHTVVTDAAKAPTCTETGLTEGKHCSVCNEVIVAQEEVDALGHNHVAGTYVEPSFDANGYTPYTCTVCGDSYNVEAEGTQLAVVAKIGDKRYASLQAAMAEAVEGDTIVLLEDAVLTERLAIAAKVTVNLNGNDITANFTDDFGAIYVKVGAELTVKGEGVILNEADVAIANYGKVIIEGGTVKSDAADYNCGLYNMYHNGDVYGTAEIKGGTIESEVWNSGVLTVANGKLNGIDNSGALTITGGIVNGTIYAQDGSDAPDLVNKGTIAISGGSFSVKPEAAWCAEGYGLNKEPVDGYYGVHKHIAGEAADCVNDQTCTVCGEVLVEAKGHTPGAAATCTTAQICTVCGAELAKATGHDYKAVVTAPTCTDKGYTTYTCTACGDSYVGDEVDALGHKYNDGIVTTEPTCENEGVKTYTCANCGDTYTETVAKLGHNYSVKGETVAPTCTTGGYTVYGCANGCGTTENRDITTATGHTYNAEFAWTGYTACYVTVTCEKECGYTMEGNADITSDVKVKPGCTTTGETEHTAAITLDGKAYSDVQKEVTAALQHNYVAVVTAPTCTAAGYTTYTCACGDSYTADEVAATGHVNTTTTTVDATCTTDGSKTVTCACGEVVSTEVIKATGHTPAAAVRENKEAATCTVDGSYDEVIYCSVEGCKAEISRETKTVKAEGHKYVDGECGVCHIVCTHETYGEDGKCVECGMDKPEEVVKGKYWVTAKSLIMEGMISVNAYVGFQDANGNNLPVDYVLANGGVKFVFEGGDTVELTGLTKADVYDGVQEYTIASPGIPAKDMDKNYDITPFIVIDGVKVYGETTNYGVLTYAKNQFKKSDEKLKSTLVALLNYGTAAQQYFNGKNGYVAPEVPLNDCVKDYVASGNLNEQYQNLNWNDSLINALVDPDPAMTVNFAQSGTARSTGKSLILEGAVSVNYYMSVGDDFTNFTNCTATLYQWSGADYAKLKAAGEVLTKENATYVIDEHTDFKYTEGYGYECTVASGQIPAKEFGDTVYVAMVIVDNNGVEHCTGIVTYSPEYYAGRKLNDTNTKLVDMVKWMVVYGERAKINFTK